MNSSGSQPAGRSLILTDDIHCPRCGYNLHGSAGPQCPECGFAFKPDDLLALYREYREQAPPTAWVIRTMRRHPIAFWWQPQVYYGKSPSIEVLLPIIGRVWCCGFALYILILTVEITYAMFLRNMLNDEYLGEEVWAIGVSITFVGIVLAVGIPVLWTLHTLLCRVVLPCKPLKSSSQLGAAGVTGYSLLWAIYALPCAVIFLLVCRWVVSHNAGFLGAITAWIVSAVLAALCILWGTSLHQGGLVVSGGSSWKAWWCVISNPFWYLLVVTAVAVIRVAMM